MSDYKSACSSALDRMADPPKVTSKIEALDGLDRLALNPNGWFPRGTVDTLTKARMAILVDRWQDAMVTLEGAFSSLETFIEALEQRGETAKDDKSINAIKRAHDELEQCAQVQSYVVARSVQTNP